MEYNIYCDESCHLLNDGKEYMVLGCTWSHKDKSREIHNRIREIKERNEIKPNEESKWVKVANHNKQCYLDLINYFFDDDDINFRAIIINKKELKHELFNQNHDDWYYKMLFILIQHIFEEGNIYNIYLDYKDTQGNLKAKKLHEVLCNSHYDFDKRMIKKVDCVQSSDVGMIQLCDILLGAIEYHCHRLTTSKNKLELVDLVKKRSRKSLNFTTLSKEKKFNLLFWHGEK